MTCYHSFKLVTISLVALEGKLGRGNKLVGDAAQCAHHDNNRLRLMLNNVLQTQNTFYGTYGRSAEFQYLHNV